ncbi:DoxX family protein [Cocleimonas sp. KMM 6892]|jgi:putative oxidoreductase|uniref:DoxX family protein n=1 Tax=unclassified Cocleimonas TaxID=2639732 RepID=UPI002DBF645C|nr:MULTISPECIES: DoxX family protein [unclassified Cocleimonas]MEB8431095.1 DoxX family protein [Cocleimonas sp. KMM 6892]MEC4714133.1 DoxX family protein [Cocleimonas sp. KMM 6895]MEC4743464.1 DoxX family protein [Cocleimonas sp. KMM 6896]
MNTFAHWFIRIPFAATFIFHGAGKFANLSGSAEMMGMPVFLLALVAIAEVLAGVGAIVGGVASFPKKDLVTRLAGLAAAPVMLGAIFMVHFPRFSFVATEEFPMGGFEFQLLLLGVAINFILTGNKESADK